LGNIPAIASGVILVDNPGTIAEKVVLLLPDGIVIDVAVGILSTTDFARVVALPETAVAVVFALPAIFSATLFAAVFLAFDNLGLAIIQKSPCIQ
jgi:hypothetical protein